MSFINCNPKIAPKIINTFEKFEKVPKNRNHKISSKLGIKEIIKNLGKDGVPSVYDLPPTERCLTNIMIERPIEY